MRIKTPSAMDEKTSLKSGLATVGLTLFLMACSGPSNKLEGTWVPVGPNGEKQTSRKVTFLPDGNIRVFGPSGEEKPNDSIRYSLINGAKSIRFEKKSGEVQDMVIVKLSDTLLSFHPAAEVEDTMHFIRHEPR